jgi:hypothetical protein
MNCCPGAAAVSVSALAADIAKGRTVKELVLLGAVYIQLGNTMKSLAAYAAFSDIYSKEFNVKQILVFAAIFCQLGNSLLTIAAVREACFNEKADK